MAVRAMEDTSEDVAQENADIEKGGCMEHPFPSPLLQSVDMSKKPVIKD